MSISGYRITAVIILVLSLLLGYFIYYSEVVDDNSSFSKPFKLGLDLKGGTHLVYEADTSLIPEGSINDSMESLREVIERRINTFGVSEPLVYTERAGLGLEAIYRLIVELPGITDIEEALSLIDATPVLEFKTERPEGEEKEKILTAYEEARTALTEGGDLEELMASKPELQEDPFYIPSALTGRYLKRADVSFNQGQGVAGPSISIEFDSEGAQLFADITKDNLGKTVAIYLDGVLLSAPVVQAEIKDGRAEITGNFTVEEARELVRNLNLGALPVPISLASSQTIGPSLGQEVLVKGILAGLVGLALVGLFMLLWYRLPGLIAVFALMIYVVLVLTIFKLFGVTLTAASIAGFILSVGIAVDANILIFERMKDELNKGRRIKESIEDGFSRAWTSIRDSNLSSIISAVILFWFGTSLIKGFALTLMIGILISMLTAITITRTFLLSFGFEHKKPWLMFLFGNGFKK